MPHARAARRNRCCLPPGRSGLDPTGLARRRGVETGVLRRHRFGHENTAPARRSRCNHRRGSRTADAVFSRDASRPRSANRRHRRMSLNADRDAVQRARARRPRRSSAVSRFCLGPRSLVVHEEPRHELRSSRWSMLPGRLRADSTGRKTAPARISAAAVWSVETIVRSSLPAVHSKFFSGHKVTVVVSNPQCNGNSMFLQRTNHESTERRKHEKRPGRELRSFTSAVSCFSSFVLP